MIVYCYTNTWVDGHIREALNLFNANIDRLSQDFIEAHHLELPEGWSTTASPLKFSLVKAIPAEIAQLVDVVDVELARLTSENPAIDISGADQNLLVSFHSIYLEESSIVDALSEKSVLKSWHLAMILSQWVPFLTQISSL